MEMIVVIGILVMGIVAILVLTSYNLTAADYGEKRLIAANLAREALEVVRQQRDSSWLAGDDWDNGFPKTANDNYYARVNFDPDTGDYAIEYSGDNNIVDLGTCGDDCLLYVTASTFNHDNSGEASGFSRNIKFANICSGHLNDPISPDTCAETYSGSTRVGISVQANVRWRAGSGLWKQVVVEDRLFNWR